MLLEPVICLYIQYESAYRTLCLSHAWISFQTKNIGKSTSEVSRAEDKLHSLLKDGYASDSSLKGSKTKKRMTIG